MINDAMHTSEPKDELVHLKDYDGCPIGVRYQDRESFDVQEITCPFCLDFLNSQTAILGKEE
jgi:hypothetical protein